ncbi:MAG: hypothetical protein JEZ04_11005 [Spirochaetales bacterium]|nr:hypothetical protein [Spirochaetales bacterium]
MKALVKKLPALLFLCLAAAALSAEPSESIDLSITIRTLDEAVKNGTGLPEEGTPVILNGTVTSRRIVTPDADVFEGELILASGEWLDSDDIIVSRCIVLLRGPGFAAAIPARRSRQVDPAEIPLNSELLAYGYFLGLTRTDEGLRAVIDAVGIRKLN